jgi:hypothetical protein
MTRVAYLIGVSGSRKGCIAGRLKDDIQVVPGDCVRDRARGRLGGGGSAPHDEWERCDYYLRNFDMVDTFAAVLADLCPELSNDRAVLAEGLNLGHDRWRNALRDALRVRGIAVSEEQLFWIDPPPRVVLHNRQQRGRTAQRNESLEEVTEHCKYYHERVAHHRSRRYQDADELIRAIREFLLR